jgi:hypothetical protein
MKVIDGGKSKPREPEDPYLWTCHVCDGTTTVELTTGSFYVNGRLMGGTTRRFCADCFLAGKKTPVAEKPNE